MAVLTVFGESYTCARAQKGSDFVRLLDENNTIVFFAEGISDFSPYVLSGGSWETPVAVIAPTVAAIPSLNGTVITLDIPATVKVETGLVVNFKAPCDCSSVTTLLIGGYHYGVVNSLGDTITGKDGVWATGAQLSVILDVEAKKAYLMNGKPNDYLPLSGGNLTNNLIFNNGKGIQGKDSAGVAQYMMFLSASNTLWIGYNMPSTYTTKFDTPIGLTSDHYGASLPTAGTKGRIFFKKV